MTTRRLAPLGVGDADGLAECALAGDAPASHDRARERADRHDDAGREHADGTPALPATGPLAEGPARTSGGAASVRVWEARSFGRGSQVERRVLLQDRELQGLERRARFDTQLLVQSERGLVERRQRVGLPTGSVEREHQLRAEPLPEGMCGDQALELG